MYKNRSKKNENIIIMSKINPIITVALKAGGDRRSKHCLLPLPKKITNTIKINIYLTNNVQERRL